MKVVNWVIAALMVMLFAGWVAYWTTPRPKITPRPQPASTATPRPTRGPTGTIPVYPTPEILTARQDMTFTSSLAYEPTFSVTIPKGAKYYQTVTSVDIITTNDLHTTMCSTCQLFVPECGGLSDGSDEGCAINPVTLGPGVTIGAYAWPKEPTIIRGYYANYKNDNGDPVGVRVTTPDDRKLTVSDKAELYAIITSIK